jgi:hypothetical protein
MINWLFKLMSKPKRKEVHLVTIYLVVVGERMEGWHSVVAIGYDLKSANILADFHAPLNDCDYSDVIPILIDKSRVKN